MRELSKEESDHLWAHYPRKLLPQFNFIRKWEFNDNGDVSDFTIRCEVSFYSLVEPK